jgi:hypothetical protein
MAGVVHEPVLAVDRCMHPTQQVVQRHGEPGQLVTGRPYA